jgi:Cu(I)/Ag(I) efflux system membrane protein CusA/SilA
VLAAVLRFPSRRSSSPLALAATWVPLSRLGGEFMPPLDEGDLLYMPSALPGMSAARCPSCCSRPTG